MKNLKNSSKIQIYGKVILFHKYKKKEEVYMKTMKIKENKENKLMQNKKI